MKNKFLVLLRTSLVILIVLMTGCSATSGGARQQDYSRLNAGSTGTSLNSATAINDAAGTELIPRGGTGTGNNTAAGTNLAANRTGGNTTIGDEIALIKLTNPVARGAAGRLTIQGRPGARYTVTAVYKRGGKTITTTENRTTGVDGVATWKWTVAPDTDPGTYRLIVSGAGKMLTTSYTVQ